jgi:Sec-independent protein translocase protein TatA
MDPIADLVSDPSDLWTRVSEIPSQWIVLGLLVLLWFTFARRLRRLARLEAAVADLRTALGDAERRLAEGLNEHLTHLATVVTRAVATFDEDVRVHRGTLPGGFPVVALLEGDMELDRKLEVWTHDTLNSLRHWLLEHRDEARTWRMANPEGFRLWASRLGADVLRQIWPEEFQGEQSPHGGAAR